MNTPNLLELMAALEDVQDTARLLKDKIASINRDRSVDAAAKDDLIQALIVRDHKIMWMEERIKYLEAQLSTFDRPDAP